MSVDILIVLPGLQAGGAERVASNLANYWCEKGFSVCIFVSDDSGGFFYALDDRIRVLSGRPSFRSPKGIIRVIPKLQTIQQIFTLRTILKELAPQTTLSFLPALNVISIMAAFSIPTKTIICERNSIRYKQVPFSLRIMRLLTYRFADLITVNLCANLKILRRFADPRKIVFLPNPVQIPEIGSSQQARKRSILAVGRLTPQKAFDILIPAYASSQCRRRGWSLTIVGDGTEQNSLTRLARDHGLEPSEIFSPATSKLWEEQSNSSIFVLASRYEGLPNALLEALAHGLVPLVSDGVGDIGEAIKERYPTLVFPSESVPMLTKSLDWLTLEQIDKGAQFPELQSVLHPYLFDTAAQIWTDLVLGGTHGTQ
jgi:GalNAc-alpha-(1->4)-GalNAc-alpha-(1->3)-diNAcBac-PP-undecaprenol alpha-1,4-N-acetyl-D-galactosaminyltransferase